MNYAACTFDSEPEWMKKVRSVSLTTSQSSRVIAQESKYTWTEEEGIAKALMASIQAQGEQS